jgi:PAS domain S-box-containing protein
LPGALVLAGGAASLAGWIFSIERLKDWVGAGIAIKPNTAIGIMSMGAALVLMSGSGAEGAAARRRVAAALAAFASAIGGATLLEHVTGRSFGLDTLLFEDVAGARATAAPGRMGPPAATSLLVLGIGVLIAAITRTRATHQFSVRSLVPAFGIAVLALSLLATCGYLFGAPSLYDVPGLTGIAFQTALMIVALAVGTMLVAPDREPIRTFAETGAAGTIARRALPLVIALPILLGWLRTRGEDLGLYGPDTGRSFLVLALIACLCGLLWWAVVGIRKSERRMRDTDSRLAQERKQVESVKARFAAIVESSEDAIISKDLNGIITSWNASAERLFGYTEKEAVGRPITMLMPPARVDEEALILGRIRRGEPVDHYETIRQRKDGTLVDISLTVSPIRDSAGNVVGASKIARDISARKRNEEALRDSEERYRSLVSVITDVPWISDASGAFATPQPHWSDYTGQTWQDLRGHGWMDALHPDDRDEMARAWVQARSAGAVYESRGRLWHAASKEFRSVLARATPLRDRAGVVREWVGTYTDVEDQVRAKDRLQTQLEERTSALRESLGKLHDSQRLVALGNLAAGLGHDIANMVLPIRARLAIIEQACATDEARGDVEAIGQTLAHLTSLSAGLRLMALDPARNRASTDATDLELWWTEAEGVMRASLPRTITLSGTVEPGLSVVMPRHQLTQAVFNLVRNAAEAIADASSGLVKVEARSVTAEDGRRRVEIAVVDNGPGLSPEALARCFEPYFSTKGRSIATGMGLAMVRGLVESAGGSVSVRSEPGSGATFTITLPSGVPIRTEDGPRSRAAARSAAISVADTRLFALAAMMLEGLNVRASRHESPAAETPDADLWVAHDPTVECLDAFLSADARRRVVVIRGPSWDHDSGEALARLPSDRVFVVAPSAPPSELRDALSAAVVTLGRPARSAETHGAAGP